LKTRSAWSCLSNTFPWTSCTASARHRSMTSVSLLQKSLSGRHALHLQMIPSETLRMLGWILLGREPSSAGVVQYPRGHLPTQSERRARSCRLSWFNFGFLGNPEPERRHPRGAGFSLGRFKSLTQLKSWTFLHHTKQAKRSFSSQSLPLEGLLSPRGAPRPRQCSGTVSDGAVEPLQPARAAWLLLISSAPFH
jgi:hypothetical protein